MRTAMRPEERAFANTMSRLVTCNHFLPERINLEREALGSAFVEGPSAAWNLDFDSGGSSPNIARLTEKTAAVLANVLPRLAHRALLAREDLEPYEALVNYHLYQRYRSDFEALTLHPTAVNGPVKRYEEFARDARQYLGFARREEPASRELAQLFAGLWQIERAFTNIFRNIVGSSAAIARLRASVWESIFTWNFKRYQQGLFERMAELTTLITGPSGTGKELVARAIAAAAFIPFDADRQRFAADHRELFFALNLAALSPNLIESELFGHRRGAFTGALEDRAGWLEVCPERGSVFLDEIGEIGAALQVKLLRVLQTRTFHRLGESRPRSFLGKIIAATNRDLAAELQAENFREDFYYRLCSDVISTPSLREQLAETPGDLRRLAQFVARQLVGPEQAEALADEVVELVNRQLGSEYGWPGNFRELEQCVRNVLVRRKYDPVQVTPHEPAAALAADLRAGRVTADALLERYCAIVYQQTRNFEETARRLDLDRRTVKAKLGRLGRLRRD